MAGQKADASKSSKAVKGNNLDRIVAGAVSVVSRQFEFTEGPVWMPAGFLLFSDIPAGKIYRLSPDGQVSVFRNPSGNSNGLNLDMVGRLLACEHGNRRVTRTLSDGTTETVAEYFDGRRLNSPNDLVVHSSGRIYFTDPDYGLEGRAREQSCNGVYRVDPDGAIHLLASDFKKPNGIGLSPDEKILYVADTEGSIIRAFDIQRDGTLQGGRVLCEVPWPDGFCVDREGRIFCTSAEGVRVFSPDGAAIGTIKIPEWPANCAFGGEDGQTLFVAARKGIYSVRVKTPGVAAGGRGWRKP